MLLKITIDFSHLVACISAAIDQNENIKSVDKIQIKRDNLMRWSKLERDLVLKTSPVLLRRIYLRR